MAQEIYDLWMDPEHSVVGAGVEALDKLSSYSVNKLLDVIDEVEPSRLGRLSAALYTGNNYAISQAIAALIGSNQRPPRQYASKPNMPKYYKRNYGKKTYAKRSYGKRSYGKKRSYAKKTYRKGNSSNVAALIKKALLSRM